MLVNVTDDMDQRLENEGRYLVKKYPNIAFNCNNSQDPKSGTREGKEYLYASGGYIVVPDNYDDKVIRKYKALLTPNSRFYKKNKYKYNITLTNGPMNGNNYYELDKIKTYDERINGICAMYKIYNTGKAGDIIHMRQPFMKNLPVGKKMVKHCYGPQSWGGGDSVYKGYIKGHPNCLANLEVLGKYRFVFSIEPMYHNMWSVDWVTERLWNAFKCKTVPIYYGCYNIEDKVPKGLYIDYRDFNSLEVLAKYLISFEKSKWTDMTEKAYDWYHNECTISRMSDLEDIFKSCK